MGGNTEHILEIHKKVYRKKKIVRVWYKHLAGNLMKEIGFKRSTVYESILYRGRTMYTL